MAFQESLQERAVHSNGMLCSNAAGMVSRVGSQCALWHLGQSHQSSDRPPTASDLRDEQHLVRTQVITWTDCLGWVYTTSADRFVLE